MKHPLTFFILLCLTVTLKAQIPQGYYDGAAGLYGTALQQALHDIIDNHTVISYDDLQTAFETTDDKPNGKVWDMYSDIPGGNPPYEFTFGTDQCGSYNGEGDCYNREHSWPKSWFSDKTPMYSDLFHLYPTDGYVNNRRSNYPYGEVGSADWTSDNGSKLGSCSASGYSGTVFEPIDAYKGDLARSYFYMSTRYYKEDQGWAGSDMTNGSQLKPWALAMMLRWNLEDPVSQKEIDRNNTVYGFQHNRNPFIDHPEFVSGIWGPNAGLGERPVSIVSSFPNPCSARCNVNLPASFLNHEWDILVNTLTGEKMDIPCSTSTGVLHLDTSGLNPGMYFIRITDKESSETVFCRIVKQ